MDSSAAVAPVNGQQSTSAQAPANWVVHATLLWQHRRLLGRVTILALLLGVAIALIVPKKYEAVTRIMPPDSQNSGALMLAALASHTGGLGGLGGLAGSLLSGHTSGALFVDLLRSQTISSHLMDRFDLQKVYRKRYRIDTAKQLARRTTITDDKKSGVITLKVQDTSPERARDLAQGYLDELNSLVTRTSASSAHRERIFIESRLRTVESDLERAQLDLSEFSSRNSTIDIKEQTHAIVDAASRVQAELLVEQSGLDSLREIYGDGNVRVRASEARIATLQHELTKLSGSSAPLPVGFGKSGSPQADAGDMGDLSPALRQMPRLAVPFADLYRRVQVQQAVYELLTQQDELARIEEAKDIPVVSVIDPPEIPEKKAFPPRMLLTALLTAFAFAGTAAFVLMRHRWEAMSAGDARKLLARDMASTARAQVRQIVSRNWRRQ
jgi:capsule polysaccharide export protein KpsE/RkpR